MDAMAEADADLTDAVIELELERLGRGAAERRGAVVQEHLLAFLA